MASAPPPPKPTPSVIDAFLTQLRTAFRDPNSKHIKGEVVREVGRWLQRTANDNDPHAQEQARIRALISVGEETECQSCGHLHRATRRTISAAQARNLITIYHATKNGAVDREGFLCPRDLLSKAANRGNETPRLKHWGLLAPHEESHRTRETNSAGLYKLTEKGEAFVEDRIRVPKAVYVYRDCVQRQDDETISIRDALGKEFDYVDLMS